MSSVDMGLVLFSTFYMGWHWDGFALIGECMWHPTLRTWIFCFNKKTVLEGIYVWNQQKINFEPDVQWTSPYVLAINETNNQIVCYLLYFRTKVFVMCFKRDDNYFLVTCTVKRPHFMLLMALLHECVTLYLHLVLYLLTWLFTNFERLA